MHATPLGPACRACAHTICRSIRAAARRGGRSADHAHQHRQADAVSHRYLGVIVWFGEESGLWRAMTAAGLHEADSLDGLVLEIWPHISAAHAASAAR